MTAAIAKTLIQQSVAAQHIAKIRGILAGEEMTPEQAALSHWWGGLRRYQRTAMFMMAGINNFSVETSWCNLPQKQRAALVLAAQAFAENMQGIKLTLQGVRQKALAELKTEARKVQHLPAPVAA